MQIAYTGKKKKKKKRKLRDGNRLSVISIAYSVVLLKNVQESKQGYIFEQEEASVRFLIYIYIYTCLNEQQQQQRFGYTECESNPWGTPMQLTKMVSKYFE